MRARLIDAGAKIARPDVFDPFYVPLRQRELQCFALATVFAAVFLTGLFLVPLEGLNLLIFALLAIYSAWSLFQGLRYRNYRLGRLKAVAALKGSLLDEGRFS